jgi:threonine/homoserine/homoserine lactone efflux protein
LIQRSLTQLYIALGLFVTATVCIGLVALLQHLGWLPMVLGIAGTVFLFYSSMLLIAETRLALRSVNSEMEFTMKLRALYQERRRAAAGNPVEAVVEVTEAPTRSLRKITQKLGIG